MGLVYMTADRVFRAVPAEAKARVDRLLESGLPDALAAAGLMPATRVSPIQLPGSVMVLEHPRLPFITYPYEWSYGMLRAAAVCVLEVNMMANRYGYELSDCHGFNVLFDGSRPLYIDLGSLAEKRPGGRGWSALEEFVRSYEYPLKIWSDGSEFMARRLVAASNLMSHADYGIYRWPWLRGRLARSYENWRRFSFLYRKLSLAAPEKVRARLPQQLRGLAGPVLESKLLPMQGVNLMGMRKRIMRRKRSGMAGFWSGYQGGDDFAETPRFRRIAELVSQAKLNSVLELAGNQGLFTEKLLSMRAVREAVCTDADELAIDRAHARIQASKGKLQTCVLDFVQPMVSPFGEPPADRLRCEGVLALAVSHHLILTQRVPVGRILKTIAAYASRSVFIEFMPLGLWDGKSAPPVPNWYNLEWFRDAFSREFVLEHEENLETNRHIFCGRVRSPEA